MHVGKVAIVGRTNVGKSTLLNALLGQPLAIVSPLPQTTRDPLLGVVHGRDLQVACIDTPGLHRPKHELGRRLNYQALETLRSADLVVFVTDVPGRPRAGGARPTTGIPDDDTQLLKAVPAEIPCVLVVNKIDRLKSKAALLPILASYGELFAFAAVIPMSARKQDGLDRLLSELERLLPEGPALHDEETLTDRPVSFFAREYIREQVMLSCRREVPHAVAVTIERFEQGPRLAHINATIHVEKLGQRGVLVGQGGHKVKAIGTAARLRLEALLECQVHLELFVRVTAHWKNMPRQLAELGYESEGSRELSHVLRGPAKRARKARPGGGEHEAPRQAASRPSKRWGARP